MSWLSNKTIIMFIGYLVKKIYSKYESCRKDEEKKNENEGEEELVIFGHGG